MTKVGISAVILRRIEGSNDDTEVQVLAAIGDMSQQNHARRVKHTAREIRRSPRDRLIGPNEPYDAIHRIGDCRIKHIKVRRNDWPRESEKRPHDDQSYHLEVSHARLR